MPRTDQERRRQLRPTDYSPRRGRSHQGIDGIVPRREGHPRTPQVEERNRRWIEGATVTILDYGAGGVHHQYHLLPRFQSCDRTKAGGRTERAAGRIRAAAGGERGATATRVG